MKHDSEVDYSNFDMERAIDEFVHNQKYREILKDKLIDGLSYTEIANRRQITERHAWTIVCRHKNRLFAAILKERSKNP